MSRRAAAPFVAGCPSEASASDWVSLAYSFLERPESISSDATTTSVFQCRFPASSSHWRVWRRPSMSTSWPFDRNWPVISARRSQATHGWYSVRSGFPPPRYSFVATVKVVNVADCQTMDYATLSVSSPAHGSVAMSSSAPDLIPSPLGSDEELAQIEYSGPKLSYSGAPWRPAPQ